MEVDLKAILHRQHIFCSTLKSYVWRKITKYQNILLKSGVQLSDQNFEDDNFHSLPRTQSFEDHIELVIGRKSASPNVYKTFWKIGNRISTLKLFRWIYLIVQRTKAARVLHHLDGVTNDEIKDVIYSVGKEIAVAYEYQLCLVEGDSEVIKLAQHAGACIVTYLNSKDAHFAPENLLQAILEVKPKSSNNKEILKTRTVCINTHQVCLRWRLSQVFKQPGLRIFSDEQDVKEKTSTADEHAIDKEQNLTDASDLHKPAGATKPSYSERNKGDSDTFEDIRSGSELNSEDERIDHFCINAKMQSLDMEPATNKTKIRRRINEVDMDFDKGLMTITERSVDASDFSSVGNKTQGIEEEDSTSVEEDLESDNVINNITENICAEGLDASIQGGVRDISNKCSNIPNSLHNEMTRTFTRDETRDTKIDESRRKSVDVMNDMCSEGSSDLKQNVFGSYDTHTLYNDKNKDTDEHIIKEIYQSNTLSNIVTDESMPDVTATGTSYIFYGCFTPYGARCRPKIYGYRGPLHIWNEEQRNFSLIYNDTVTISRKQQEESIKPKLSFHQQYIPKTMCKH